uniref:Uncharacterized protein n=1 Tax=Octopus bimaculoides TaxID=37653 RepID=A0A0L8HC46_OCTBM
MAILHKPKCSTSLNYRSKVVISKQMVLFHFKTSATCKHIIIHFYVYFCFIFFMYVYIFLYGFLLFNKLDEAKKCIF